MGSNIFILDKDLNLINKFGRSGNYEGLISRYHDIEIDGNHTGRIVYGLFGEVAPKAVENFKRLCACDAGIGTSGKKLCYHGSKFHRALGSIGNRKPTRTHKGKKMHGHHGDITVTIKKIPVELVNTDLSVVWVRWGVPGARNSFVKVIF